MSIPQEKEAKNNPFSKFTKEELEDHALKILKQAKYLRNQKEELINALKKAEDNILHQTQQIENLENENQNLKSKLNLHEDNSSSTSALAAASLSLSSISRKFTSILNQKPESSLSLNLEVDKIFIDPNETSDSPQTTSLKLQIDHLKQSLSKSQKNEISIKEFASTLQTKLENKEYQIENLNSLKDELQKYKNNFNDLNLKYSDQTAKVQKLEIELSQSKKREEEVQSKLNSLQQSSNDLNQLMEKYSELVENHEILKSDTIQLRFQLEESERKVLQLKESLKRSMRDEQEKDEQISLMSQKIKEYENEVIDFQQQVEGLNKLLLIRDDEIKSYQKNSIEKNSSEKVNSESDAKIQKMQRLVEKSNSLYAEMQMKANIYETRVHELEKQIHNIKSNGSPILRFLTPKGNFVINDNGTYFKYEDSDNINFDDISSFDFNNINNHSGDSDRIDIGVLTHVSDNEIEEKYNYLKKMIIQYFRSDQKIKTELTPVILNLLDVSQFEIKKIMSGKNSGIFSFF